MYQSQRKLSIALIPVVCGPLASAWWRGIEKREWSHPARTTWHGPKEHWSEHHYSTKIHEN